MAAPGNAIVDFERRFFFSERNKFVGSGAEVLIKADAQSPPTRLDVGDRFIGIGATHFIQALDRPPGPDSLHSTTIDSGFSVKAALRSIEVANKRQTANGFEFDFAPLRPRVYSETLEAISGGAVRIDPDTIPEGAVVLSFVDPDPTYTLRTLAGSPSANWIAATKGLRHWNVGIATPDDFWWAEFPADDVGVLSSLPPTISVGSIRFGMSLLSGSLTTVELERVSCDHPSGRETQHHFCLEGVATGTAGIDTPFPIGVRTEITFLPISVDSG